MANFYLAFDLELAVVPVLNKIDLPAADPEKVAEQVQQVCTTLWGKEPWRQLCQPDKNTYSDTLCDRPDTSVSIVV